MNYRLLSIASFIGGVAVVLGAWAAHGLIKVVHDADKVASFKTGVDYQFSHALFLILIALLQAKSNSPILKRISLVNIIGIILFSGSIYLLALSDQIGLSSFKSILGPITPIGGLFIIVSWGMLCVFGLKQHRKNGN